MTVSVIRYKYMAQEKIFYFKYLFPCLLEFSGACGTHNSIYLVHMHISLFQLTQYEAGLLCFLFHLFAVLVSSAGFLCPLNLS